METNALDTTEKKKWGPKAWLMLITLGVMLTAFAVETIAAVKEGRGMNLELINKLLDTLLMLLDTAPVG
jgi:hypothetical protein